MDSFVDLLIFGAGKMGGAMLHGALKAGWPAKRIRVIDPNPSDSLREEAARHGFALNPAAGAPAKLVLLAIKPQMLDSATATLQTHVDVDTVIVSILAGKSIADLRARLPGITRIVRAMPNTPAAIGRGITGAHAAGGLSEAERQQVLALLQTTGRLEWLDHEGDIDSVTALSGSGPAYVFHLVEAMAKAGEELGLAPDLAMRLARATVEGAGELLFQEAETPPATLRQNVTSPGGTTAAALDVLMAPEGLQPLMTKAIKAARARARALAG
ncbi:MAG: pyrroline-5-carboxylate reductase [Beijerinckiaceae bacterium]|nr:pyrroline-5-carboxylate reductase [Beijerinckiaceae bacterium]